MKGTVQTAPFCFPGLRCYDRGMSEDRRKKPTAEDVDLIPAPAFEREVAILFAVPKAELQAVEAARLKRPSPKRHKGAA